MHKQNTKRETVPTIWRVPDDLWARIAPILAELDPPKPTGRRRDPRPRGRRCHHLPARVQGVNGISSPETSLTIVRSIARSSVGFSSVSSTRSGSRSSRLVLNYRGGTATSLLGEGLRQSNWERNGGGLLLRATHPAHWRGKAGYHKGATLSRQAMGGGTYTRLGKQMPCDPGAL